MPKRIPIKAARDVAKAYDLQQVCLVAWDGRLAHVVTYGTTIEACDQAAQCGNVVKKALGFPDIFCNIDPSRVKKLKEELANARREHIDCAED